MTWLKDQPEDVRHRLLGKAGSLKALAKKIGCSEAALRPIYMGEPTKELGWSLEKTLEAFERYRSVRFVAHMHDTTESLVRREVDRHNLELSDLTDYSQGGHANGKGRRAELEFAKLRGDAVLEDLNKTQGSQALFDFLDRDLGRVNVKSSRQHRFKAQSRQGSPDFWKFSTKGHWSADVLICMAYDRKMEKLVGIHKIHSTSNPAPWTNTITVTREQLESPDALRASNLNQTGGRAPLLEGAPPQTDGDGHGGNEP